MLRNYFKIAFRNLLKHRAFSIINILGLAIGVASSVLIGYYVKHERSYEDIHENAENIFRLSLDMYNGNEFVINDVETYQQLGPHFKETMPEVIDYARLMHYGKGQIQANEQVFYEDGIYLGDPSVFTIFSYKIVAGDPVTKFEEPFKATISERIAEKYFGTTEVIGETFQFNLNKEPIEIVGVTADTPQNTHMKFDILLSHASVPKYWEWYLKYPWDGNNEYTYLLMQPGTSVSAFNEKLKDYSVTHKEIDDQIIISECITDIHLYSNKSFEPEVNGSAQVVNFMTLIALFIIIIAWVNYVNLSTSRAINRAKEVGIRKVVGSTKYELVKQFLIEAFLINLIACLLAFTIVQLAIPSFSALTGQQLPKSLFDDAFIWYFLGGIVLIGTVLSGIYPAFVLSSYKPATVLKGKFGSSSSGFLLRKGLVVFQFLATVVLIAVSLAVYHQIDFIQNQDLGVNIDNTLIIRSPQRNLPDSLFSIQINSFADRLKNNTYVASVGQSDALPGANIHELSTSTGFKRQGADENEGTYNYYIYGIDKEFVETLDINITVGRNFVENENEEGHRLIINERAVETLGFESPEQAVGGKVVTGGDNVYEIIGVVSNFHQRSPKEAHLPMIFRFAGWGDFLSVKLNTQDSKKAVESIEEIWETQYPDAAFDYYFLNDEYNHQYKTDKVFSSVTLLFTILSVIIAVLGLFGLSSFAILQRTKEIGVRKVLGASVVSLIRLLSSDFIKLVVIAGFLAIPLAYLLINKWLENYAVKMQLSWWLFVIPMLLIAFIAMLTIIRQVVKIAVLNPVDTLRDE